MKNPAWFQLLLRAIGVLVLAQAMPQVQLKPVVDILEIYERIGPEPPRPRFAGTIEDFSLTLPEGKEIGRITAVSVGPNGDVYMFNPSNGVAVTLTSMDKRQDLVQRFVDATLEATRVTATDKAQTVQVLMKDFDQTEANASKLWELLIPSYTKNGRADPRGIKNQLEADAKAMQLPDVKTEADVYDWRFLPK